MRGLIIGLSVALVGWMAGSTHYYICNIRGLCEGQEITDDDIDPNSTLNMGNDSLNLANDSLGSDANTAEMITYPMPRFAVGYQDSLLFESDQNFRFGKSHPASRMTPGLEKALAGLAKYMEAHPEKEIQITGSFAKDEDNNSSQQNIGLGRAAFVKGYLEKAGLASDRIINSFAKFDELPFDSYDSMNGGIEMILIDKAIEKEVEAQLLAESKDIYFEYNSDQIVMNDDLRKYLTNAVQHLNQNPNTKLSLTGHTDNKGNPPYNLKLGKSRAQTLAKFFKDFGAKADQINTSSKGQSSPLVPNTSEANRAKNRRVEIRFK